MWSSDPLNRRAFLRAALPLAGLAGLAACGFEPVLAPGGSLDRLRGNTSLATPNTRNDFNLRDRLARTLGDTAGGAYGLTTRISTSESAAGITPDQVITRQQIDGQADYVLTDVASGAILLRGTVNGFTSYGTTGTTASTAFARTDAFQRLMVILADQIVTRLAAAPGLTQ